MNRNTGHKRTSATGLVPLTLSSVLVFGAVLSIPVSAHAVEATPVTTTHSSPGSVVVGVTGSSTPTNRIANGTVLARFYEPKAGATRIRVQTVQRYVTVKLTQRGKTVSKYLSKKSDFYLKLPRVTVAGERFTVRVAYRGSFGCGSGHFFAAPA